MKKAICALLSLMLLLSCACAQSVRMGFEDGFSLELPADWQYYTVDEALAEEGVVYCLSDAKGACWLYIQHWDGDCADTDALQALVQERENPEFMGVYEFNGIECVVYDLADDDVSCCSALINGSIIHFMFTPRSDADYMKDAADILQTLSLI